MVTATGSTASQSWLAQFLQGAASPTSSSSVAAANTTSGASGQDNPATNITLSSQAKAILAQAQEAQAVADRLQQAVDSFNGNTSNSQSTSSNSNLDQIYQQIQSLSSNTNFQQAYQQLLANTPQPAASQIVRTLAAAGVVEPGELVPVSSFSTSLQVGGYTASVDADAQNGAANITITMPNGSQVFKKIDVGGQGMVGGQTGPLPANTTAGSESTQNNVDTWTFVTNNAAAEDVSASSSAGTASASAANAQSSSITFSFDFNTGTITASQSGASLTTSSETTPETTFTATQSEQSATTAAAQPRPLSAPLSSFI
jgi:hypothetical protein